MDAIEAVKIGINVEQKSIDFYTHHAETSDNEFIKETFNIFTNIEKKHKKALEENLNNLQNEGLWYGYVPILEG
jgi:rubrerythrin